VTRRLCYISLLRQTKRDWAFLFHVGVGSILKSGLARPVQRNQRAWLARGARWALQGAEPLPGRRSSLHNNHRNVEADIRADTSRGSSCLLPRRSARNASIKLPLSLDRLPARCAPPSPRPFTLIPNSPSCIIQDDPNDWTREAALVGAIFQNAHLTLSATSAKNSKKGFLHPRRPRFHPPTLCHSSTSPSLTGTLVLRPWLQTWAASVDGPASPLSGRGWVLQERLLAPRTLHFRCEQLFWECRERRHPEGHAYQSLSAGDKLWFRVGGDWEVSKLFLFPGGAEGVVDQVRRKAFLLFLAC
jgi:hypothetical protein